ncbi:Cytochrome P450 86B1 [Acorus calamus]|uniref:Cytochrome P450 86B1 n=1 Tax=Acorus calamus TaxID=4465 RepID=A0AAV9DCJ7_ACOCL|nr:Cytochrome P450 86B1 [Acorus calamus]
MLGLLKYYPEILLALSCFLLLRRCLGTPRGFPITWPVLGMLPGLLSNLHRFHDWMVPLLRPSGLTFFFRGPLLSNLDFVFTCDPANVNHILKSRFADYPKGPEFPEIFQFLGDGIFTVDDESWAVQRKAVHALFADANFRGFVAETTKGKAETAALVPILARAAVLDLGLVLLADEKTKVFDAESLHGLEYLHAALCETLRLYPSVPVNQKWAAKADVLPSGVTVEAGTWILISMYAMGRMEEVWGKDCEEFRPERWITEHVEAVEGHVVEQMTSVVFRMKKGFLAKVRKRRDC